MNTALVSGLINFSPLDYHADCRCADRSSTWCIFRMCNSSNHGI